jgi:hypothetical protein
MRCETCRGTGDRLNPALDVRVHPRNGVSIKNPHGLPILVPCAECGGCGILSCCDGAGGTEADLGGSDVPLARQRGLGTKGRV